MEFLRKRVRLRDRRIMLMRSVAVTLFVLASWNRVAAGQERESELKPGPFAPLVGSTLGQPIIFENMVHSHPCFPLIMSGEVAVWIHRAHAVGTELVVQRCVEYDPSMEQTTGNRHGGVKRLWERVIAHADGRPIEVDPLSAPDWGLFANPTFCGGLVAYWGTQDRNLIPSIYDITSRRLNALMSLGRHEVATDNAYFLPRPEWDAACEKASFNGTAAGKARVELLVQR